MVPIGLFVMSVKFSKTRKPIKGQLVGETWFYHFFHKVRSIMGDLQCFYRNDTFQSFISCLHNLLIQNIYCILFGRKKNQINLMTPNMFYDHSLVHPQENKEESRWWPWVDSCPFFKCIACVIQVKQLCWLQIPSWLFGSFCWFLLNKTFLFRL